MILENTVAFPEICYPNSLSRLAQECQWNQHCQLSILEMVLHVTIDSSVHKYVPLRGSLFRGLFGLFYYYSRVPNKRTPPPLIRNFQKNPKNWPNFGEKNQFSKKQKGSHENRMLEINELIILHIFHTFLYPR